MFNLYLSSWALASVLMVSIFALIISLILQVRNK